MSPKDGQLTKHKIVISSVCYCICETFNYTTLFFVSAFQHSAISILSDQFKCFSQQTSFLQDIE